MPAPTRVLHVVGRMDRAGAETMLMNYYRAIDRDRYQFDFLVFTSDRCDYDEEIEFLGGRIVRIESRRWLARTLSLIRILRSGQWRAIHAHTNFSSMFPLFAGFVARVPVRIAHAHVTEYVLGSNLMRTYHAVARLAIRAFSTDRAACGRVASELLYKPSDVVTIIPNAIPSEEFMLDRTRISERVRRELRITQKTMLILQIGRLAPVKNQTFTLEVASILKASDLDFAILLVGRGILEAELCSEIERRGLSPYVRLLGVREDIPELMNAADALILPSIVEGFPVVLVEAQAAGLPCLVSDRVSPEVDLGLGLARFLAVPAKVPSDQSARCAECWAHALLHLDEDKTPSVEERMEALRSGGFSVSSATERLTRMYDERHGGSGN